MTEQELRDSLKAAKRRNPAAYSLISIVSGVSEARIKAIAKGESPDVVEKISLESAAGI